ncbi:hypothetical protein T10_13265 [Trichinella papuae]|uniref:Uncharacterized protein n=1 Tax=Trichinella papuae TaxID=268474 RepID=A0A0V1M5Q5_9BILA|nr:hypothetical protein T10_13265 [Trichinella papuae]
MKAEPLEMKKISAGLSVTKFLTWSIQKSKYRNASNMADVPAFDYGPESKTKICTTTDSASSYRFFYVVIESSVARVMDSNEAVSSLSCTLVLLRRYDLTALCAEARI